MNKKKGNAGYVPSFKPSKTIFVKDTIRWDNLELVLKIEISGQHPDAGSTLFPGVKAISILWEFVNSTNKPGSQPFWDLADSNGKDLSVPSESAGHLKRMTYYVRDKTISDLEGKFQIHLSSHDSKPFMPDKINLAIDLND